MSRLSRVSASFLVLLTLAGTAACKKTEREGAPRETKLTSASAPTGANEKKGEAPATPFPSKYAVPRFTGAFPHAPQPLANIAGRAVKVDFVRFDEKGKAIFAITNLTKERVVVEQTWIFYYDANEKYLERYPHALGSGTVLEPGQKIERDLGRDKKDLHKRAKYLDGEVTKATVAGAFWANENLIASSSSRPRGGYDATTLAEHAGEQVIVEPYTLAGTRVRLTNIGDKPVKQIETRFYYRTAKDEIESGWMRGQNLEKPLEPGQSVDVTLSRSSIGANEAPPDATKVVAFAPEVTFTDGTRFSNQTLLESIGWAGIEPSKLAK